MAFAGIAAIVLAAAVSGCGSSTGPRHFSIEQVRAAFAAHEIHLVPIPLHALPPFDVAHGYTWLHGQTPTEAGTYVVVLAKPSLTRPPLPPGAGHEWLGNVRATWFTTGGGGQARAALHDLDASG
jgi:hypothetical protein